MAVGHKTMLQVPKVQAAGHVVTGSLEISQSQAGMAQFRVTLAGCVPGRELSGRGETLIRQPVP